MLKKIEILLSRFGKAFVKHAFRESNRCEDALAKVDSKLNRDIYIVLMLLLALLRSC